ncbi:MAG TPA: terminase family protein [Mycobacterium sp.]|jgi:phage terminase large subunit-like protein|nr:terminase family protein [Mycobacterium sp.]
MPEPPVIEAPLDKLTELAQLREKYANLQKLLARHAAPRPRPWHTAARDDQKIPATGDASVHLYLAGRGWGKSATGSNWLAEQAATNPDTEWAVVAPTWRDCRKVCIEGQSGILRALLPGELDSCNASDLTVRLTNGSKIYGYSADRPDRLRGANLSGAWIDELASMVHADDLWGESLMPALRIGERPQVVVTTTPRPVPLLRELLARTDGSVRVVRGKTWDNAENLSKVALAELKARYEGTRMGRQELEGELLDDVEGALWNRDLLDDTRVDQVPPLVRIVVGVDPATTSGEKSDFTGIVVAGRSADGHLYVLQDATMKGSPRSCMAKAVSLYHQWHADRIVGETNNGGDYIENLLRTVDPNVPYRSVRATRGKIVRAEPISSLWEQHRAHIVGCLPQLEDQMCAFTPDSTESPDNLDALVWSATELTVGTSALIYLNAISTECPKCEAVNPKKATHCRACGAVLSEVA